jgi:hypothetical protein
MPTKVCRSDTNVGNFSISTSQMRLEWVYKVAGDFNELTCRTAVDDTTGLAVPLLDSEHPLNANLIVSDIAVDRVGYSPAYGPVFEVRVTWSTSVNSYDIGPTYTRYMWDFEEETETVDSDVNGRAFVNTAFDPVTGGFQCVKQILVLRVWRQEPVFDVARAYQSQGRVNSDEMAVLGQTFPKGSMLLWSYRPTQPLRVGQTGPIETELLFKFKEPKTEDDEPWQAQMRNVGFNGYGTNVLYGPFRPEKSSDFVTDPIPLDLQGKPLYGSYKIGISTDNPITTNEAGIAAFFDAGFPKAIESNTKPKFLRLIFQVRKDYDFRGFVPGVM